MKMLLTDKQTRLWINWFIEQYEPYCTRDVEDRLSIPIIYCDNPEEEEKKHADMWLNKIRELMGNNADKKYTHRGGRTETYAEAQFNSLWLYNGPIFKHISEKENAQYSETTGGESLGNLHGGEGEEQEIQGIETSEE